MFATRVDIESKQYAGGVALRQQFANVGAVDKDKVIAYCGGGIAACSTALVLIRLGVENVAIYDGSLTEWSSAPICRWKPAESRRGDAGATPRRRTAAPAEPG